MRPDVPRYTPELGIGLLATQIVMESTTTKLTSTRNHFNMNHNGVIFMEDAIMRAHLRHASWSAGNAARSRRV